MEFDVGEDFFIGPEVYFGTALVGIADYFDRGYDHAVDGFDFAVLRYAAHEFHFMLFAIATDGEAQQFG